MIFAKWRKSASVDGWNLHFYNIRWFYCLDCWTQKTSLEGLRCYGNYLHFSSDLKAHDSNPVGVIKVLAIQANKFKPPFTYCPCILINFIITHLGVVEFTISVSLTATVGISIPFSSFITRLIEWLWCKPRLVKWQCNYVLLLLPTVTCSGLSLWPGHLRAVAEKIKECQRGF